MCLGGGGYMPQPISKPSPPQLPGPASPDDTVNNQPVPNAQDRTKQKANRNKYDPDIQ